MRQSGPKRSSWIPAVLAAMGFVAAADRSCPAQVPPPVPVPVPATRSHWVPLARALEATSRSGVPTLVVITSPTVPTSLSLCRAMAASPEVAGVSRSVQFAEMDAGLYRAQVQRLGVQRFPTLIVYRRGPNGVEAVASTSALGDPVQIVRWLEVLGMGSSVRPAADRGIVRTAHDPAQATGQTYPSAQQSPPPYPPSKQPMIPPPAPPSYAPPPPVYAPPPVAAPPTAYMAPYPAPAPVYLQPPSPTMIVQQAPQQIILAPSPPPQITVAMAPPMMPTVSYAPVGGAPPTAAAPPTNLFAPPAGAPPAGAPPAGAPPAGAPPYQPVMMAPPMMMAPPSQAPPQQVGQGPILTTALAMTLTNPSLLGRVIGSIGEHFAQKKNPRIQMASAPAMSPAPVGAMQAPIAMAPTGATYAYAPAPGRAYGYAPAPGPAYGYVAVTPEATSFAPCNTYRAPCRFHGGPCPGPGPRYVPPPPSGPVGSPQLGAPGGYGYAPARAPQAPRKSVLSRLFD